MNLGRSDLGKLWQPQAAVRSVGVVIPALLENVEPAGVFRGEDSSSDSHDQKVVRFVVQRVQLGFRV